MLQRNYLLAFLIFCSVSSAAQSLDSSLISQLTPDQIAMAREVYSENITIDKETENLPLANESLVNIKTIEDSNKISGKKFGYDFFSSMPTSLTAVGDLPLPNDYKISLRDQLRVILSGSRDAIFDLNVKLDGTILFPELGSMFVVGQSFEDVKEKISDLINQAYIGVNVDVSIQNLSAKKITIVGAVKTPGTYLVNPFTTITTALAYSGGISDIGSLRDIKLIRNNKEIHSFDLYELLIKGDRKNDITIEAGDTILINSASQFVEITGAVKRPAIYEVLNDEKFDDIVQFALGFEPLANKSNISASFLDLDAGLIVTKNIDNLNQNLSNVLSVNIFSYKNEESSNIKVEGAIEEPGFYKLANFENLEDLISNLEFVDVYPWLGVLEQFDENKLITSIVLFNLNDPSTYSSIQLLPNSRVFFADINERSFDVGDLAKKMIKDYELKINYRGLTYSFPVYGKYYVKSFVDLLGLDMSDVDAEATYISPLDSFVSTENYKTMQFVAKKYHIVSFRSRVNELITVNISGAVEFPGMYSLDVNSTVEDLYRIAGGFKNYAYLDGIIFIRDDIKRTQIRSIEQSRRSLDNALLTSIQSGNDVGDINLIRTLSDTPIDTDNLGRLSGDFTPNSRAARNTTLLTGDSIIVPKNPNSINVLGEVLNPTAFVYSDNLSVNSAIKQAGGFQEYADKRRVYVIKADGSIKKVPRNVFSGTIDLDPGDTVVVPRKIIINARGLQALIPVTRVLSDIAFSASALESLANN